MNGLPPRDPQIIELETAIKDAEAALLAHLRTVQETCSHSIVLEARCDSTMIRFCPACCREEQHMAHHTGLVGLKDAPHRLVVPTNGMTIYSLRSMSHPWKDGRSPWPAQKEPANG